MNGPWTRDEFYRQRDLRSNAVLGRRVNADVAVHVVVDSAACRSVTGQVLLFALANQLVRVHRNVSFHLATPDQPLLAETIFGGRTLGEVTLSGARQIDPFGSFELSAQARDGAIGIGIGAVLPRGLDWYLGAEGANALLDHTPLPLDVANAGTMRGAALASCLGAAAVFRSIHGLPIAPRTLSAWTFAEGVGTAGPADLTPVDVGRVLVVGAGAVASALAYWLYVFGARGSWSVIDADVVGDVLSSL
jgi:hypothetical protein